MQKAYFQHLFLLILVDSDVDNDQSVRLTSLVQGSLSFHSPADYMNELNNLYNTTSALSLVPAPMDFGVSAAAAMNRHLPSSASLYFVPSVSGTQTLKKATKRRIEDLQDPNHFETKMRKSGGSDKSSDFGEVCHGFVSQYENSFYANNLKTMVLEEILLSFL